MSKKLLKSAAFAAGAVYLLDQLDKRDRKKALEEHSKHIVQEYRNGLDDFGELTPEALHEWANEINVLSIQTDKTPRALLDELVITFLKETGTLSPAEAHIFHTKICLHARAIRPAVEERLAIEAKESSRLKRKFAKYSGLILVPALAIGGLLWNEKQTSIDDLAIKFEDAVYTNVKVKSNADRCIVNNTVNAAAQITYESTHLFLSVPTSFKFRKFAEFNKSTWPQIKNKVNSQISACEQKHNNQNVSFSDNDYTTIGTQIYNVALKNI